MSHPDDREARTPTVDVAEDNAFFPSPYSLTQYTSAKTDFDGLGTELRYTDGRWKVLLIATEERYMLLQNGRMFSTGNHPVETLLPAHHILAAGFDIEVATLTGAPAKFEWWAFPDEDAAIRETWEQLKEKFKSPKRLADVVAEELGPDSNYLGVFVPGGHGAALGLPDSADVQDILDWALAEEKAIVSLCHGPAAFLAAAMDRETSPFAGYQMCVFPDALDEGPNQEIGYLPGAMPWLVGEALQQDGVVVVNKDITGAVVRDRNVITGDSPLASNELGKQTAKFLLEKSGV